MAKRVLVPLDRTPEAEAVVPLVKDLLRGGGGLARLIHVAPVPTTVTSGDTVVAYADQEMSRLEAEGLDYLRTVELQLEGAPAEAVVRFGDAAGEILIEADGWGADLVVVSTTTRSGLRRALLGSVAEQVLRRAKAPVLLFRSGR